MLKMFLQVLIIMADKWGGKFLDILADVLKEIFDTVPNGSVKAVEQLEAQGKMNPLDVAEILDKHEPELSKKVSGKILGAMVKNGGGSHR